MISEIQKKVLVSFAKAVYSLDRFEAVGDGPSGDAAKAFRRAFIKACGRFCDTTNSEEFAHISMMHRDPGRWAEAVFIAAADPSFNRMRDTLYGMLAQGRKVLVFTDAGLEVLTSFRLFDGSDINSVYRLDSVQTGTNLALDNLGNLYVCRLEPGQGICAELAEETALTIASELAKAGETLAAQGVQPSDFMGPEILGGRLRDISFYRKVYFQDSFHAQCLDLDPLCMDQFSRSLKGLKTLWADAEALSEAARMSCGLHGSGKYGNVLRTTEHVILCGCGDSYVAAQAAEAAFRHYLPDIRFEAVEGIELSRHYDFSKAGKDAAAVFISYSGTSLRTLEAMKQCRLHDICTVAVTGRTGSPLAQEADLLYNTDNPPGDNNAGLRTYFSSVLSCIMLAACMAEHRDGISCLNELEDAVKASHDSISAKFAEMDDHAFRSALACRDKRFFEILAPSELMSCAAFIQAKIVELSGDPCEAVDENELRFLQEYRKDREQTVVLEIEPAGIPQLPEVLGNLWNWLPAALFAGFRHTTIGEPMFRGGFDPDIFNPTYFSPVEIVR